MQAFGPYAEKEIIDFRKLENRTMFVISGKTGAGKTTIFDGITFAIFGKASGEDRNGTDLRSHFAPDHLLTEVSLLFTIRNKQYYVVRSPQQEKKKDRGEGYTTINAKAELYFVKNNGEKELIAANVREVDEKMKEIIQLDVNQFRQILMIPQGEFRKLLVSDSKDKEVILQRLFNTTVYKKIEEQLKEDATEIKRKVEEEKNKRDNLFQQIEVIHHEELKQLLASDERNETLIVEWTNHEIHAMKQQLLKLKEQIKTLENERNDTYSKFVEAKNILEQLHKLDELKKQMGELEQQKNILDQIELEVQFAMKAKEIHHQEQLCQRLKNQWKSLDEKLNRLKHELNTKRTEMEEKEKKLKEEEEKESVRNKAQEKIQQLKQLKEDVYSFDTHYQNWLNWKNELETVSQQLNEKTIEKSKLEELINSYKEKKSTLEDAKYKSLEYRTKIEKVKEKLMQAEQLHEVTMEIEELNKELEIQQLMLEKTALRIKDAKEMHHLLERKWRENQAHLLAQSLEDGHPCPVCGSTDHPRKAGSSEGAPTIEELDQAKADIDQFQEEKVKYEEQYYKVKSIYDSKISKQSELLSQIELESVQSLSLVRNNLKEEEQLLEKLIDEEARNTKEFELLLQRIEKAEKQLFELNQVIQSLNEEKRGIENKYIENNVLIEQLMKKIPASLRNKNVFEDEYNKAEKEYEQLLKALEERKKQLQQVREEFSSIQGQLKESTEAIQLIKIELTKERTTFKKMLEEKGFQNYQAYEQAKRTDQQIQELQQWIQNYRETYRSTKDQLEQLLSLLKNVEKPDIAAIEAQLQTLNSKIEHLQNESTTCSIKLRKNEELVNSIEQFNESIKQLEEQYQVIGHLSDIARGQNVQKITFERYVLASFLEEILHIANIRLSKMTNGRYRLLRRKNRSKGNIQSGLELHVFDQYTGQERHVKTLSGGESFKASLALALGLSEVVQQYAGGVSLETMFIDEGFGTLDPESLDSAVESLIEIQGNGRLVGIISHVPELKERIGAHLEVTATQTGSKTEFVFM
jgi:DNA repair protein SbcC/Rad50